MTRDQLLQVRAWADEKIATGTEPPWAWYQYMKLRETMDAILAGMDATATQQMASSPGAEARSDGGPRLVVSNCQRDTARPHQETVPVQTPM